MTVNNIQLFLSIEQYVQIVFVETISNGGNLTEIIN